MLDALLSLLSSSSGWSLLKEIESEIVEPDTPTVPEEIAIPPPLLVPELAPVAVLKEKKMWEIKTLKENLWKNRPRSELCSGGTFCNCNVWEESKAGDVVSLWRIVKHHCLVLALK